MTWLTDWNKRKSKIINGTTTLQTNYQMKLTVHKGIGTDTTTDVYLGTNVRDDFGDVRFTSSDGSTLINYWIEYYTFGSVATIWIKIDSIPITGGTIYIYYDNPIAISISNGDNTFMFFDDFSGDLSKWNNTIGSASVSGGIMSLSGNSNLIAKATIPLSTIIVSRDRITTNIAGVVGVTDNGAPTRATNTYTVDGWSDYKRNTSTYLDSCTSGVCGGSTGSFGIWNTAYYINKFIWVSGSVKWYKNDVLWGERTVNIPTVSLYPFYSTLASGGVEADYIYVRKYASPEPTFGITGTEEILLINCPITTKYSGDTVTLSTTPIQGVAPYTIQFRKSPAQSMGNDASAATEIILDSRIPGGNNISGVAEGTTITRIYILDSIDLEGATTKSGDTGPSIIFATEIIDSCSPSQSCTKYCKVFVGCTTPVCDFTVT